MPKFMKIVKTLGLVGMGSSIILILIGLLFGGSIPLMFPFYQIERESTCISDQVHIGEVISVDISIAASKVVILPGDAMTIRTDNVIKDSLNFTFENDHLTIIEYPSAFLMNSWFFPWGMEEVSSYITITLPSTIEQMSVHAGSKEMFIIDRTISSLTIYGSSSSIDVSNSVIETMTIYGDEGTLSIDQVSVTNEAHFIGGKGEIFASSVNFNTLNYQGDSGNFIFDGVLFQSANISQGSGQTLMNLKQTDEFYLVDHRQVGVSINGISFISFGDELAEIHIEISGKNSFVSLTTPN